VRRSSLSEPQRLFTREFKVEAIKLVTEQGRSFAEAFFAKQSL
jgi:transposase-like protein